MSFPNERVREDGYVFKLCYCFSEQRCLIETAFPEASSVDGNWENEVIGCKVKVGGEMGVYQLCQVPCKHPSLLKFKEVHCLLECCLIKCDGSQFTVAWRGDSTFITESVDVRRAADIAPRRFKKLDILPAAGTDIRSGCGREEIVADTAFCRIEKDNRSFTDVSEDMQDLPIYRLG